MFLPQLPITFVFGRPTRLELLGLSGCALLVVSVVAWARTAAQQPPPAPAEPPPPETAQLEITSTPSGADVSIDGQPRGLTPATVAVVPGRHDIVLQAQDAIVECLLGKALEPVELEWAPVKCLRVDEETHAPPALRRQLIVRCAAYIIADECRK